MSKCVMWIACPFYHRRIPIHDVMYRKYLEMYCEGDSQGCAIFQVMEASSFLNVPKDLYPNQTFRVAEALKQANP